MHWSEREHLQDQASTIHPLTVIAQYKQHAAEVNMSLPTVPTVFM